MNNSDIEKSIKKLMREDCRYSREAYFFVADAVTYTASHLDVHRHLTAVELLEGAKRFGKSKFGCLSDMVLNSWGLVTGKDVGNVVYLLIGEGILSASEDDDIADFDVDFSFMENNNI
ncbi:MAG: hypothetical protein J6Q80_01935 [Lentisphaeria bacterium]|nr:hypothetical protein [Lentisphaeria bacterium]